MCDRWIAALAVCLLCVSVTSPQLIRTFSVMTPLTLGFFQKHLGDVTDSRIYFFNWWPCVLHAGSDARPPDPCNASRIHHTMPGPQPQYVPSITKLGLVLPLRWQAHLIYVSFLACPTCNDFHGLVQKIMELQDILAKTSSKVNNSKSLNYGLIFISSAGMW